MQQNQKKSSLLDQTEIFGNNREILRRISTEESKKMCGAEHDGFCVETQIDTIPLDDSCDASVESEVSEMSINT